MMADVIMEPVVKEELKKFGETISVKGISRILKARSVTIRTMWLIAVLTCSGILIWQVTSVFSAYFRWPVETSYKEGTVTSEFPDVTICKLYSPVETLSSLFSYEDYLGVARRRKEECPFECFRQKFNIFNITKDEYDYMWSELESPQGYSYLFTNNDDDGFCESLIRKLKLELWGSAVNIPEPNTKPIWDVTYNKCCTIQLNSSSDRKSASGFTTILYIDNFPKFLIYSMFDTSSVGVGVRVTIHAPGTRPNLAKGISIGPGIETTINVYNTIRQRTPYPYSDCTQQRYVDNLDETSVMYTVDDCYDFYYQQAIVEQCHCIYNQYYFSERQWNLVKGEVCGMTGTLNDSSVEDIIQWACSYYMTIDMDACDVACPIPCKEYQYDLSVSSVPWPHPAVQLSFYDQYILQFGEFFGDKFSDYDRILKNKSLTEKETIDILQTMHGLEQNFIQLNVVLSHYKPMVLMDAPSMTADKMLSMIGGSLSLWLGITVMTIVEFVQFIFDLVLAIQTKRKLATESRDVSLSQNQNARKMFGNVCNEVPANLDRKPPHDYYSTHC